MAFSLPKYQRQVAPSKETGAVRGDVGSAGAQWGAVANFADTVGAISSDFAERKAQLKYESDVSDYEVRKLQLGQRIDDKKTEEMKKGTPYWELEEKAFLPVMEEFDAELRSSGYSDRALREIDADWNITATKQTVNNQAYVNDMMITDMNLRKKDHAEQLELSGDFEGANKIWDSLEGTTKAGQVAGWKSESIVGRELVTIRQADMSYDKGEITRDEYKTILEQSNKRIEDNENVLASDKHRHKIETIGKMSSVIKAQRREKSSALSDINRLDRNGELDAQALEQYERVLGPDYVDTLMDINYTSIVKEAVTEDGARESLALIDQFKSGDLTFNEAIKKSKKLDSAGKRAFWQISEMQKERYDSGKEDVPASTFRTDYFEHVSRFINLDKEGIFSKKENWYDKKMDAFENWNTAHPNATQEEYKVFRMSQLNEDVVEFVKSVKAPQQANQKKSGGTEYTHPSGRKYKRFEDGSIEWL